MEYLKILVVVVHITSAALLFGAPLGITRMAKNALATSDEAFKLATLEVVRRSKLAGMGSMLTLFTGVVLIFLIGGFAAAPKNFHAALGVMLLAVIFSFSWLRPNAVKLAQAGQQSPVDKATAQAILGRLAMGNGILHLVWLCLLCLMFLRF